MGTASPSQAASLTAGPRDVARSEDSGRGRSSAKTLGPMASEGLCSRLHSSVYRNWAPGESGCLPLAFTWNCVIYNYITNSCCRTDALNYLVYEKWLLYAGILSGMKWDYFNIRKWMAVLSFSSGKLSAVTYSKLWFPRKPQRWSSFFSKQCLGMALRCFSWLIPFWIREKFLFINPNYEYLWYYWKKSILSHKFLF